MAQPKILGPWATCHPPVSRFPWLLILHKTFFISDQDFNEKWSDSPSHSLFYPDPGLLQASGYPVGRRNNLTDLTIL